MSADLTPDTVRHTVLIVEDRREIALRLKAAIEKTPELTVCAVADDVDGGLNQLFEHKPRIVLVDLGLPDGSGIEVIKAVSGAEWTCEALVVSIFGDEARVIDALRAGARGYVLKSGSLAAIGNDVLSVIEGGSPISPQIARHLLATVGSSAAGSPEGTPLIDLTARETEILDAVAKGYKRREIGQKLGISTGTVGNHINNIYQKLNVNSNIEAIARATRMGLL